MTNPKPLPPEESAAPPPFLNARQFESNALDLVADTLAELKPEELEARRDKLIAIVRNGAAWLRGSPSPQPEAARPTRPQEWIDAALADYARMADVLRLRGIKRWDDTVSAILSLIPGQPEAEAPLSHYEPDETRPADYYERVGTPTPTDSGLLCGFCGQPWPIGRPDAKGIVQPPLEAEAPSVPPSRADSFRRALGLVEEPPRGAATSEDARSRAARIEHNLRNCRWGLPEVAEEIRAAESAARAEEREKIAKLADSCLLSDFAAAIRARGSERA